MSLMLVGCAITTTRGPAPGRPADERPDCTTSYAANKVDGAIGVVGLFLAIFGGVALDLESGDDAVGAALLVGGLGTAAGALGSAYVGYRRVERCRDALDTWDRDRAARSAPAAPAALP